MSLCGCRGRAAGLGEDLVLVALSPHAFSARSGPVECLHVISTATLFPRRLRRLVPLVTVLLLLAPAGVADASPYPTPGGGTVQVYGAIEEAYLRLGGPSGFLGRPLTDELGTPDRIGRYNDFEYGSIYWSPTYGAYEIHGSIRERWATLGSEAGALGYPVSDQLALPDGRGGVTHFEHGSVYWHPVLGAFEVLGDLRAAWQARGAERGPLGYPVSGEYAVPGGRASDFEHASLGWDAATRTVTEPAPEVLSRGVTYRRYDILTGPFSTRVLTLAPIGRTRLDLAIAQDRLAGFETTSSMARRHHAVAAVNGDFALPNGRPVHLFAEDGHLLQSPALVENAMAGSGRGVDVALGQPAPVMTVNDTRSRRVAPLARVNSGAPAVDELSMVTPAAAGLESPPSDACSARLRERGRPHIDGNSAMAATYVVHAVACGVEPMAAEGLSVLSAPLAGSQAAFVRDLRPGRPLRMTWSVGWPGVQDVGGGNALLVEDGQLSPQVIGDTPFFARHPRTGIGVTATGEVLLVTVDGRQDGLSVGMTLAEFGEYFRSLGAVRALLLDGGGSTTMVVRGDVRNSPSDGNERPVGTAVLVLDRADTTPPDPWPGTTALDADTGRLLTEDDGSTGGWAQAMRSQGVELPEALDTGGR